ncbi:hypothetical protein T484DRAFT_1923891 [Baffinella frigidus]|nr:hypothetical protein T484DRAFT_1923891 [Cryptophyta sp. CCMP2293]
MQPRPFGEFANYAGCFGSKSNRGGEAWFNPTPEPPQVDWQAKHEEHDEFATPEQEAELQELQDDVDRLNIVLEAYMERVEIAKKDLRIADDADAMQLPVLSCKGKVWTCAHQRDEAVEMDLSAAQKAGQVVNISQCSATGKFLSRICSVRVVGTCARMTVQDCSWVLILVDEATEMVQLTRCAHITLVCGNELPSIEIVDSKEITILGSVVSAKSYTMQTSKASLVKIKVLEDEVFADASKLLEQSARMRKEMNLPDLSIVTAKGNAVCTTLKTLQGSPENWTHSFPLTDEFCEVDRHAGRSVKMEHHVRGDLSLQATDGFVRPPSPNDIMLKPNSMARLAAGKAGAGIGASPPAHKPSVASVRRM